MIQRLRDLAGLLWTGPAALVALVVFTVSPAGAPAPAGAVLKPEAAAAFASYARATEARLSGELKDGGPFLWIDRQPARTRGRLRAQVRGGDVAIERLQTRGAKGEVIDAPGALIHHWIGTAFVAGATTARVLAVLQDYDNHYRIYSPDVMRSKTLARTGGDYKIYLRLFKKKIISVVLDTEHDAHFEAPGPGRALSRSYTTRVTEIENPGEPTERAKPVGSDSGFMWKLYSYWRIEEREGGVFIQCEAISLTRDIPTGLGWLIGPFVNDIPRESLLKTLDATRAAVRQR